jgi:type VI protein secretion system component VasF
MAETETNAVELAPGELVNEIERTRADLARTIDEIADRVTPSRVAQRASARVREQVGQIDPLIGGAVVLAAVSVTCYLLWRRIKRD